MVPDLRHILKTAGNLGHSVRGFTQNKQVSVAQCENCLDYIVYDVESDKLVSPLMKCLDTVNKKTLTFRWTTEDQEAFQKKWGKRNEIGGYTSFFNDPAKLPGGAPKKKAAA